jgi:hypothetical protein
MDYTLDVAFDLHMGNDNHSEYLHHYQHLIYHLSLNSIYPLSINPTTHHPVLNRRTGLKGRAFMQLFLRIVKFVHKYRFLLGKVA